MFFNKKNEKKKYQSQICFYLLRNKKQKKLVII